MSSGQRWLILITRLSGPRGTARMRSWRALKASGAGILRDGAYLLPDSEAAQSAFATQQEQIERADGSAYLLCVPAADAETERQFIELFDRRDAYRAWQADAAGLMDQLQTCSEAEARRAEGRLRRALEAITAIDFFPQTAQTESQAMLTGVSDRINARFSPDEPSPGSAAIERLHSTEFQGRVWATRRSLWVDRVASAWLIRRFVDSDARFLWLEAPADCPANALGFDFDGAAFTHVGDRVTFEVLLASFDLANDPALQSLAALVHYLDVGGPPIAEAAGFEAMLAGIKQTSLDDDAMLSASSELLDHLYAAFTKAAGEGK